MHNEVLFDCIAMLLMYFQEGQVLEISQVNDIRLGLPPKINVSRLPLGCLCCSLSICLGIFKWKSDCYYITINWLAWIFQHQLLI